MQVTGYHHNPEARRTVGRHSHVGYEFHYAERGSASFEVGDDVIRVGGGDLWVLLPDEEHRIIMGRPGDGISHFQLFVVMDDTDRALTDAAGRLSPRERVFPIAEQNRSLFEQLRRHSGDEHSLARAAAEYAFTAMVAGLVLERSGQETIGGNTAINRALRIMDNRFPSPLNVTRLAAEVGLSEKYFITLFTRTVGESPKKYDSRKRLEFAQSLLRQNERMSVKDVAVRCGFEDQLYFSRFFRKWVGVSPSEWRG